MIVPQTRAKGAVLRSVGTPTPHVKSPEMADTSTREDHRA